MSALQNNRHELFAQEVAKGTPAMRAYELAGFAAGRSAQSNAYRLMEDDGIIARIAELQLKGAAFAALTIEELITTGRNIITKALEAADHSAASATLERVAKIGGLWVDRTEGAQTVRTVSAEPMTPEQWQQQHAAPQPLN